VAVTSKTENRLAGEPGLELTVLAFPDSKDRKESWFLVVLSKKVDLFFSGCDEKKL
jgi:hypothetical protein